MDRINYQLMEHWTAQLPELCYPRDLLIKTDDTLSDLHERGMYTRFTIGCALDSLA